MKDGVYFKEILPHQVNSKHYWTLLSSGFIFGVTALDVIISEG